MYLYVVLGVIQSLITGIDSKPTEYQLQHIITNQNILPVLLVTVTCFLCIAMCICQSKPTHSEVSHKRHTHKISIGQQDNNDDLAPVNISINQTTTIKNKTQTVSTTKGSHRVRIDPKPIIK